MVFTQEEPEATFIDCGWNPSLQVIPIMGTTSKALLCECTLLELLRICRALLDWAIDDKVEKTRTHNRQAHNLLTLIVN